jgi:hypothetical protein
LLPKPFGRLRIAGISAFFGVFELMYLILAILRFLLALLPELVTEAQLVPIRSRTAVRACSDERLVRYFWLRGVGWHVTSPEWGQQRPVIRYLPVNVRSRRLVAGRSGVWPVWCRT